jgi:cytochrome b subunit of formate dehydrogenase
MFDIVQRLFHWANFMLLGLMALTGVALFLPGVIDAFLAPLGIREFASKVYWHVNIAWGLLLLIAVHIVWDTAVARGWGNIWPTRRDFSDAGTRTRNFLGLSHDYPRSPKYDLFMKSFHWGLTVSLIILGITGLYFWNPFGLFPGLSYNAEFLFRLLHDFFAFLLIGLIIGHMYFALIPVNWPILKAMVIGYITLDDYLKHFGMTKWKPKAYKTIKVQAHLKPNRSRMRQAPRQVPLQHTPRMET